MNDFKSLPIGTGAELARLNDLVNEIREDCRHPKKFTLEDYNLCLYCEVVRLRQLLKQSGAL